MTERYAVVAGRIRRELADLEGVVARAERATAAARQRPQDQDLYLDSAVLNLHGFYAGLERVFQHIAATMDRSVPTGHEWHRELLRQMNVALRKYDPRCSRPRRSDKSTNICAFGMWCETSIPLNSVHLRLSVWSRTYAQRLTG